MSTKVRIANENDWPRLFDFYRRIYRAGHPLLNFDFWKWQYGDPDFGGAIAAFHDQKVVGHIGVNKSNGLAWIINAYLDPEFRGQGILRELYSTAEEFGPLAATNVNAAGTSMYRKMGWIRYANLIRLCSVRKFVRKDKLVKAVAGPQYPAPPDHHYWKQPGIAGLFKAEVASAVDFRSSGGLRIVSVIDTKGIEEFISESGALWADYITSWNDPIIPVLESFGWSSNEDLGVPWNFNPLEINSKANINVFSKDPLPRDLIIKRWDSDHGRIGSLR